MPQASPIQPARKHILARGCKYFAKQPEIVIAPNPANILIVISGNAMGLILQILRGRYTRDVDFTTHTNPFYAAKSVEPNKPQLLFVDGFNADYGATVEFVRKVKAQNPQLIPVLYCPNGTYYVPDGEFKEYVYGDNNPRDHILIIITRFLKGELVA